MSSLIVRNRRDYDRLYRESVQNPDKFWGRVARETLTWRKPFSKVYRGDFAKARNEWFVGGKLNLCENALDRHLKAHGNKAALIWEADNPSESRTLTYQQLHREVCRWAMLLRSQGVKRGDRVTIYLPMIPELVMAVLACARIGAVHCVIFGGFSPEAIKDRVLDSGSHWVITADGGYRSGNLIPLKANIDAALESCPGVRRVFVVRRTRQTVAMASGRDLWVDEHLPEVVDPKAATPAVMDAEDALFILYTSGSTGKPKGVLHTTGGYGVYTALTSRVVFDLRPEDVYFCTADIGWVTGHSYLVYGPLLNAATCVLFEGVPTYPDAGRFWQLMDRYGVTIFYTSPTAIRSLMRMGEAPLKAARLDTLRLLGSVGEPINPEAWRWYHKNVGRGRCPIVDTWWQTETGGILITPLPYETKQKPGSATKPFFGVQPILVNEQGQVLNGAASGHLCLKAPWPSIMRTVYGDPKRFFQTYFSTYKGLYFTGDGCTRDRDGDYWITGRVDDVLNVSGHRIGTAEIESALVLHRDVAEAAVVGYPHDIKGQGIYCYVTLKSGVEPSPDLKEDLRKQVAREISPIAKPDVIQWAPGLPKTRSGKIMRRILRKIAHHEFDNLGDTTTLADPAVVESLIAGRQNA